MIRAVCAEDMPILLEISRSTDVFRPAEMSALEEVLQNYLAKPGGDGYYCCTYSRDSRVVGFCCYGPNTMTDRTWNLYWIVVRKDSQGHGIGSQLLRFVEEEIRRQAGRLLMVETSSLPSYEPTRRFYTKHSYEQVGVVKDFYADGDSLVIFCKRYEC